MIKEAVIQKIIRTLNTLPTKKAAQVADFADYLLKKHELCIPKNELEGLVERTDAFQFLNDEEDLYTAEDIKEKY
jgi:hypothetical protein